MSRIRIVNLPKHVEESELRAHLKPILADGRDQEITEVAIVKNPRGIVRMAFVGFASAATADAAVRTLNESFVGTMRIKVELATGLNVKPKTPAPVAEAEAPARRPRDVAPAEEDEQKKLFVATVARSAGPTWEKELFLGVDAPVTAPATAAAPEEADAAGYNTATDADFLTSITAPQAPQPEAVVDIDIAPPAGALQRPHVALTNRVHVSNLPFVATEADVRSFFSTFGVVTEVHIPLTKDSKQSKGAAFVRFRDDADAAKALAESGAIFMGRLLRTTAAEEDPYAQKAREGRSEFVATKEARRQKADEKGLSWSAAYVGNNAAVQMVAKKLQVDASSIVGAETQGAAVRAAIAEAHVTMDAKQVLGREGINFDVVADAALHTSRSDTTILVKHIAPGTPLSKVTQLFSKFGQLDTVAAPEDLSIALVAFAYAQDARVAFQRLAYKPLNGSPLFLEWAPVGTLKSADEPQASSGAAGDEVPGEGAVTVYVTNLPFKVREADFTTFLHDSVPRLAQSPELVRSISVLANKGRAFVTLVDAATCKYVISRLEGKQFDGRPITVQESKNASRSAVVAPDSNRDPLKLIIKNLPFEATESDLRQLFAAFSQVKSVRVPKRLHRFNAHHTNNHRGFGFVEFLTEEEAAKAKNSLTNTHLYGRHLVLDYAERGASIE
jgi:multiple RNA-binding domain-containing protein 1